MKKLYKIKKSKIDNKGLYASKDIKDRSKIIEYKGKILTKKEVEKNPKFDNEKAIYLFNINKKYDLELINFRCKFSLSLRNLLKDIRNLIYFDNILIKKK